MITSVFLNGSLGIGILVAILFAMGPMEDVMSSEFSYPFVAVFQNVTKSKGGTTAMTAILLSIAISGSMGLVATSSRMLWAFAREGGVPGSRLISRVRNQSSSLHPTNRVLGRSDHLSTGICHGRDSSDQHAVCSDLPGI